MKTEFNIIDVINKKSEKIYRIKERFGYTVDYSYNQLIGSIKSGRILVSNFNDYINNTKIIQEDPYHSIIDRINEIKPETLKCDFIIKADPNIDLDETVENLKTKCEILDTYFYCIDICKDIKLIIYDNTILIETKAHKILFPEDCENMFNFDVVFKDILIHNFKFENADTSLISNMKMMFMYSKIENLDLSKLDLSNVRSMQSMFVGSQIENLNISNLKAPKLACTNGMFMNATITNLDLSGLNIKQLKDTDTMFFGANIMNLNLSNCKLSNESRLDKLLFGGHIHNLNISNFKGGLNKEAIKNMIDKIEVDNVII